MDGKDQVVAGSRINTTMAAASGVVPDRLATALAARETKTQGPDGPDDEGATP
jgi:hypothetical protein